MKATRDLDQLGGFDFKSQVDVGTPADPKVSLIEGPAFINSVNFEFLSLGLNEKVFLFSFKAAIGHVDLSSCEVAGEGMK